MERKALLDLLSAHADDLLVDQELDMASPRRWLAAHGRLETGYILELLQLAQAIQQALNPVAISTAFRVQLGRRLVQAPALAASDKRPLSLILLLVATIVGFILFLKPRLKWNRSPRLAASTITAI